MRISSKTDPALIKSEMNNIKSGFLYGIELDLKLSAKRTAFYCAEYTLPISKNDSMDVSKLIGRISSDVDKAFPTLGNLQQGWIGSAYSVIEDSYDKKAADRFYQKAVHLQGKTFDDFNEKTGELRTNLPSAGTPEEEFQKFRKAPRKVDDKGYSALLKSKGTVRNGTFSLGDKIRPLAIVRPGAASALAAKRQKKAGLAKAAWYQSVFALGGQRNFTKSVYEEGRFKWPSFISSMGKRYKGIGSCTVTINESVQKIEIHNHLRYTDHACPSGLMERAELLSRNAMRILFEKRAKAKQAQGAALAVRRAA